MLLLLSSLISANDVDPGTTNPEKSTAVNSKYTRGNNVLSGLTHECGVFGAIASGDWPTSVREINMHKIKHNIILNNIQLDTSI